jgi:hypothetical protein
MVQYFSLTANQSTVLSVMAYQPSEQGGQAPIVIHALWDSQQLLSLVARNVGTALLG